MNYIKLVNQFWQVRRSTRITNVQADLYFFLLQECNERGWQNPFQCANITIQAGISVAMSTLQDARRKLVDHGLIYFEPGEKNVSHPTYQIVQSIAGNRHRTRYTTGNETGDDPAISSEHKELNENSKQKQKQGITGQRPATGKKKKGPEETTEHWKKLVDTWFNFYEQKFEIPPTFDGTAGQNLKKIITGLKKISTTAAKPLLWDEAGAARVFEHFLKKAYQDKWLRANFLMKNLYQNFDKIVTPKNDGNQQQTGGPGQGGKGATINELQQLKRGTEGGAGGATQP